MKNKLMKALSKKNLFTISRGNITTVPFIDYEADIIKLDDKHYNVIIYDKDRNMLVHKTYKNLKSMVNFIYKFDIENYKKVGTF